MLIDIMEDTEFHIKGRTIQWDLLGDGDYNYDGYITEGIQREGGWVVVNVDCCMGYWVTMIFKEENEIK